jgi:dipeptidyl aminopeptidase/acylaminoacyl peptidase
VKPVGYYILDLVKSSFFPLMSSNIALEKAALAPMKTVTIPSGDLSIPGYLTLPVGKDPKNLPTVVYPHGGPYYRDSWGYDPVLQMMVSRGYAVLQVNFRGSTGYGQSWFEAGLRGWGTVIHDDITAGARWLIKEGIADPKRMCIVGWSHGGYAALIGVVKEPDLYQCAVSIAGVSDLNDLSSQESFFYGGRLSAREGIGANRKELKEVSPLQHADQIKVPVLLVHGEADYTVLASHSKAMAKELRRNKVPSELVLIKDGGHSLEREDMRLALFQKLDAFLAAHLGSPH